MGKPPSPRKVTAWSYVALAVFTAISIVVPVILDKQSNKNKR
jgi:hypothetical protein